jgi:xanthosine utilization system XapX-like protein
MIRNLSDAALLGAPENGIMAVRVFWSTLLAFLVGVLGIAVGSIVYPMVTIDCEKASAKYEKCFRKCWGHERSKVPTRCLSGSLRVCNYECMPSKKVLESCWEDLPSTLKRPCFLCPPERTKHPWYNK